MYTIYCHYSKRKQKKHQSIFKLVPQKVKETTNEESVSLSWWMWVFKINIPQIAFLLPVFHLCDCNSLSKTRVATLVLTKFICCN